MSDKESENFDKDKNKSKKPSKKVLYALILIVVIIATAIVLFNDFSSNQSQDINQTFEMNKKPAKLIGNNSIGSVYFEGPYGNEDSKVKIAYILGQHPRERNAHEGIYKSLITESKNLKYAYYIYNISVKEDTVDFEDSRMNGQLLAQKYVVKHVNKRNYDLVIDVHASNGAYIPDSYIFSALDYDKKGVKIAKSLTKSLKWLVYYTPASYSSPQYSTIPIAENGTPAIILEIYGNPDMSVENQSLKFVHGVDNLTLG